MKQMTGDIRNKFCIGPSSDQSFYDLKNQFEDFIRRADLEWEIKNHLGYSSYITPTNFSGFLKELYSSNLDEIIAYKNPFLSVVKK